MDFSFNGKKLPAYAYRINSKHSEPTLPMLFLISLLIVCAEVVESSHVL